MKKALSSFFRQFKEESIMIPLLMTIIESARQFLMHNYPEMGTFIPEAELFIFAVKLWQMLWITSGVWFVYRIVFPAPCKDLVDTNNFYSSKFNNIQETRRSYFSLSIFIALLFAFVMLFNGANGANSEELLRKKLCDTLSKQLYVRELTGHNDGAEVALRLKAVGVYVPASWCGGHVGYNFQIFNIPNPNSAWSPAYANPKFKTKHAQPGDVFTLYYKNLKRVGHVGFVVAVTHGYYRTNEGNTGGSGVREGDGVHSYMRRVAMIYQVNDYISPFFKNQLKRNEKAIITTGSNGLFAYSLQNKKNADKKLGDNSGFERYIFNYYYNNIQGQYFACEWRQYINPFAKGQHRANFAANSGNWKGEAGSKKCKWSAISKMPVQGFGIASKASGNKNTGVQSFEQLFSREKKYHSKGNKEGTLYSTMVNNTYGGRMDMLPCTDVHFSKENTTYLKTTAAGSRC